MRKTCTALAALLIGLCSALSTAHADDIEIYTNPGANNLKAPMTILVLDLNLLGICNNVITNPTNPNNPSAPQLCLDVRNNMLLSDLLGGLTSNPTQFLSNLLLGTGTNDKNRAQALCNLYGILGINSPLVTLPAVGILLQPLLGGVSTLSCGTLNFLLGIPLLGSIIDGLLGGFVGQLVAGLVNPLLTTVVGELPGTVIGLLNTTISGVLNIGQVGLISLLESILNQLVNSKVAIMVSHGDRASLTGNPASSCAFGDSASIPTSRRETQGCSNGAYFLVGFTDLANQGTINQLLNRVTTLLTNTLNPTNVLNSVTAILGTALTTPTQLLPPYQGKEVYAEIAHYLSGDVVYNAPLARWDGLTGLLTRDTTVESSGRYLKTPAECRSVNVLNVQLTNNLRDNESDGRLRHYFPGAERNGAITFPDLVRQAQDVGFLDGSGNRISLKSHFLIQDNLSSLSALTSVGANVHTYVNNLGLLNLGKSTGEWFKPVLDVDASLLTPSQIVDITSPNRTTGDALFSLFHPLPDQKPRWAGNIKKLRVNNQGQYLDQRNAAAIADDGRIEDGALTYWTDTATLGGLSGDGRAAALGGAGRRIIGTSGGAPGRTNASGSRKLFYEKLATTTGALSLYALEPGTAAVRNELRGQLTAPNNVNLLGAASDTEAQELLLYARGYEVGSTSASKGVGPALVGRDWLHGAVLHSRPLAINYGGSPAKIRNYYGAADGYFRAVDNSTGNEAWAFMPRAVLAQQKILRDNNAAINFPYGVDGAPVALIVDRSTSGGPADGAITSGNAHDKAMVFFGLRRSGNHYYALDVKNPDSPVLKWRLGPEGLYNSTGLVSGSASWYPELAMTFSTPSVGRMRVQDGSTTTEKYVLVFGGGYNGGRNSAGTRLGKDLARASDNLVGTDDNKGNAIYIVDAETGELVWKAVKGDTATWTAAGRAFRHPLLTDSIPAELVATDTDGDGYLDRLYVADTGGRLWRGDLPGADRSKWTFTAVASVGRNGSSNTVADDRRFFHAPDYVPIRGADGNYDAVIFGSGNREDPLDRTTRNWLYVFRDSALASGKTAEQIRTRDADIARHTDFADLSSACASGNSDCADHANLGTGWRLALSANGEKALSQPLTVGGTVLFTSYVPEASNAALCEPSEGSGKLYGVSLRDSSGSVPAFIAAATAAGAAGDRRSRNLSSVGLAGEVQALGANAAIASTDNVGTQTPRYFPIWWRERRGEDDTPVPQH